MTTITKISDLNLQIPRNTSILGTISSKTEIRPFKNGKGKLFEVEIFDGKTIKMVFFGANADKHYEKIEKGKTYRIEAFYIVAANAMFDPGHIYKLTCNDNTQFIEDNSQLFEVAIAFTPFKEILESPTHKYYGKKVTSQWIL